MQICWHLQRKNPFFCEVYFELKRALHYPFNWIRFLEINKLCNVIVKNLTFSTNWKWKWMNRIRHGRKIVVGKQKFELIWKIIHLHNSNQSHVIKMARKKARLSETERIIELRHEEESLWNILSDKKRKKVSEECRRN